jgi:hypothetical protein
MTEKKIQEYLHLYGIDCPVMTPDGIGSVLAIYSNAVEVCLNVIKYKQIMKGRKGGVEMHYKYFYPDIKLILRPLSDMTEEEMLSYARITRPEAEKIAFKDGGISSYYNPGDTTFYKWAKHRLDVFTPEETLWLLSKHFDILGLIESGLALDKTKQP